MEVSSFAKLGSMEGFYYTLHPKPTVVLITLCPNGRFNAMPASWNMPVSEEPPTVAVAVFRETYTFECLEHHPEATINVPHSGLADVVYALGSTSGRNVDKIMKFNLKLESSEKVKPPRWSDAVASLEGRVHAKLDVGEVRLYVFEILAVHVKRDLYTRWGWDFTKTNILLHGAGRTFYHVGRMIRAQRLA
jgi:flavin reductase (DIM6/NTAB) family NADH-FMN oxidoreductase RutF